MLWRSLRWITISVFLVFTLFGAQAAQAADTAQTTFGVTAQSLQHDLSAQGLKGDGKRLTRLTCYRTGATEQYFTRWVQNDGRQWNAHFDLTGAVFHAFYNHYKGLGWRPTDVSGCTTAAGTRYAVIWEQNPTGVDWAIHRDVSREGMQDLVDTIIGQGWKPRRVEGYTLNGDLKYISLWEKASGPNPIMRNKMTREQYNQRFDEHTADGYHLRHVDAFVYDGEVWYAAIWDKAAPVSLVRTNRDWRKFQRYANNYWEDGYALVNFYAVDTPDGLRYGGIWVYDSPLVVNANSSLHTRVAKEVMGAPARAGAAVINLTTGQETMVQADQEYVSASVIKIGILYALLKEIDRDNLSWFTNINSGDEFGGNQCSFIQADTDYTVRQLAQFMIRCSNNWATNRLIQRIGVTTINNHLDALGLDKTRLNRYMQGDGAPSIHGNSSAAQDRAEGWENISTPREMATLLKKARTTNVLSETSRTRFWQTLGLDNDGVGVNNRTYVPAAVWGLYSDVTLFNKNGSLSTGTVHYGDAGMMIFPANAQGVQAEVVYAVFANEVDDDPNFNGDPSTGAITAIQNVGLEIAKTYHP